MRPDNARAATTPGGIRTTTAGLDGPGRRRRAFVEAAQASFFLNGYADTTMSSIAENVGGSKSTLWSYFPTKEHLFAAVVDNIVEDYGRAASTELSLEGDAIEILRGYAVDLLKILLSEPILALIRLITGEGGRFPELATLFYERGPQRGKQNLAAYFQAKMTQGVVTPGDPVVLAQQFIGLCKSGAYQKAVLGLPGDRDAYLIEREIEAALGTFARAWIA